MLLITDFFFTLKQLAYGKVKTETEIGWVTSTSDVKEVTSIKKDVAITFPALNAVSDICKCEVAGSL